MVKDECILVNEQDVVTGHANKYQSHRCGGGGCLAGAHIGDRGSHCSHMLCGR